MRLTLIAAAAIALSAAAGAQAQTQAPQGQQPQSQQGPQASPQVTSVNVVDVTELPADTKKKVEEVAAKSTPEDLKGLRAAIDQSPDIKKALTVKGADSSQVVVANLDQQGMLTLVTKKRG